MEKTFDLIIIGAGPAGLAASIYASRYEIGHIIVGTILGGQISETHLIDNYPGLENMSGFEFAKKWGDHAKKYGTKITPNLVKNIEKEEKLFSIKLDNQEKYKAKAILLATGTKRRRLNAAGEEKFIGKGVSYCATCDGFFYKNKTVAVIGGSDSACSGSIYLGELCDKVYLIYRKSILRAEPFWMEQVKNNPKIEVIYDTNIVEFVGDEKIRKIKLDKKYNNSDEIAVDGVFVEIGSDPDISYAKELEIETDEGGYVKTKADCSTSVTGVWAAGDITDGSDKFRQVITAAAEGAIATRSVFNWLKKS
jgi:thioredoxin reductase (NADPH)